MADFKTVKTFTLLAKIGSGLSLSALFPAAKSSKVATFLKICTGGMMRWLKKTSKETCLT